MSNITQTNFEFSKEVSISESTSLVSALNELSEQGDIDTRGAIFTRREVVDFILDLVGYTESRPLYKLRLLEPSFGGGDFLLPIIQRLIKSWRKSKTPGPIVESLSHSIQAVELHRYTFDSTRQKVIDELVHIGISDRFARMLADAWLIQGDFLLVPLAGQFNIIVGNPPYVRQELIPALLLNEYRRRYQTIYDRADLYIPFIERSLLSLKENGTLGFICADRWLKNKYGGPLRKLVSQNYHLKIFVDMIDTPAFHSEVKAYPAITIISREKSGTTRIAHRPTIAKDSLISLAKELRSRKSIKQNSAVREITHVSQGSEPWLLASATQTALIRRLEINFPTLDDAFCKVGIGVATGADKEFIGDYKALDVEPDRKLPLVMTRDIVSGEVKWRGQGVINPFEADGTLVDLRKYPLLRRYLNDRREPIAKRHCARKAPATWYRTIDRISPDLTQTPKLLVPDIKGEANIVFESGKLYPHHNLYYITSSTWDLRALQAVLLSDIARLFVATYSVKMRGGYLRFQAQYLRRIRIPYWQDVPIKLQDALTEAAQVRDLEKCNEAVYRLYGLTREERALVNNHRN